MNDSWREQYTELFRAIPPATDRELLILKGHLVVEQFLLRYIEQHVANPAAITRSRLNFNALATLAEALCPVCATDGVKLWEQIHLLNRLRNELAHQLEPITLQTKVAALIRGYEKGLAPYTPREYASGDDFVKLRFVIGYICMFLAGYTTTAIYAKLRAD
jgi:hypothetical protein